MARTHNRLLPATTIAVGCAVFVIGFVLSQRDNDAPSWKSVADGFLAVPTPCCTEADLWNELDTTREDGQRGRPASAEEAAEWLDAWRDGAEGELTEELQVAAENQEVRCVGKPTGPAIFPSAEDTETLETIQRKPECSYAKWRIWSSETAERRHHERRTVWVDEAGFFHGRIDHWKPLGESPNRSRKFAGSGR
jgi:hypothetical protein